MTQKIWPEAVKRWYAVLDTFKDKAPAVAFSRLSIALRLQGYIEEAEKVIYKGMEKYPNNLGIYTEHAEIAMAQKDWPEALKRWEEIIKKYGDTATPRVINIAKAMYYMNNWENKRKCNICGCMLFGAMKKRKSERCLGCGSYLRTRLLYLYIQHLDIIKKSSTILHLAPERGLYEEISKIVPPSQYIVADYDPSRYSFAKNIQKFDLCHDVEGLPDNHFDLIIHCHVMEHVPCNYSYVLKHLHRSLKEDGWHICVIPFLKGYYDECFAPLSDEEAQKRFGQFDHVRRIGTDDICNTFGRVISIETDFDATKTFSPKVLLEANIPENSWKGLTPNTVLTLRKKDYKL
jgi:phosphoglycolate phosphatase